MFSLAQTWHRTHRQTIFFGTTLDHINMWLQLFVICGKCEWLKWHEYILNFCCLKSSHKDLLGFLLNIPFLSFSQRPWKHYIKHTWTCQVWKLVFMAVGLISWRFPGWFSPTLWVTQSSHTHRPWTTECYEATLGLEINSFYFGASQIMTNHILSQTVHSASVTGNLQKRWWN